MNFDLKFLLLDFFHLHANCIIVILYIINQRPLQTKLNFLILIIQNNDSNHLIKNKIL